MLQIVFNEVSAAELSQLPTPVQFQLLEALNLGPEDFNEEVLGRRFGVMQSSKGLKLYRCRAEDYRIYFAMKGDHVVVHRVLHRNSLKDFLFRSNLPGGGEDEALSQSSRFWKLIDEGARTLRAF
jgi:mRNA-degrading endonuclease RelE of RelBE toxin-antitoxin system